MENNDVASQYPDIVTQMVAQLTDYEKIVVKPLNGPTLLPDPLSNPKYWGDKWSPGWC